MFLISTLLTALKVRLDGERGGFEIASGMAIAAFAIVAAAAIFVALQAMGISVVGFLEDQIRAGV